MEIEQSASINEKSDPEIVKENEETKEKKRKRNREYQRAWRQRKKDLKKKVSKEEKEEKKRKRNRENQRAYYQRIKALKENDKNVEELSQKKLDDFQMKRKKLDSNKDQQNVVQCRASQNSENEQLEQNQFLTQQLRILYENTNKNASTSSTSVQMEKPEVKDQEAGQSSLAEIEIKMELEEEDPLNGTAPAQVCFELNPLAQVKEDPDTTGLRFEDGFSEGSSNNLPKIYMYTVTKYLSTDPCTVSVLQDMEREKHYIGDKSVGFVQLKRHDKICTVKCMVASNATTASVNSCTLICNENTDEVDKTHCTCGVHNCKHVVCAMFWLHRRCEDSSDCPSYWVEPSAIQKKVAEGRVHIIKKEPLDSESEIGQSFSKLKASKASDIFIEVPGTLSNENIKMLHEQENYSSPMKKYRHELEETKVSLYKLMCNFKETTPKANVDEFLEYCMKETQLEHIAERASLVDEEVKKEILFGRITDSVVYEVASGQATDVERLVNVMLSEYEDDKGLIDEDLISRLEQGIKSKIAKCGVLISNTAPMFAATPYGMTADHVVDVKWIKDDQLIHDYIKHHAHEYTALTHLQMFISNKRKAYLCVLNYNKQAKFQVVEVALNDKYCRTLIQSCTAFWKSNVFHVLAS